MADELVAEEIVAFFNDIDVEKRGTISKASLLARIDRQILEDNLENESMKTLRKGIQERLQDREISLQDFHELLSCFPRTCTTRAEWVDAMKINLLLVQHLKVGNVFDGLKGVREMTLGEIQEAFRQFCDNVKDLLVQAWSELAQVQSIVKTEESNTKFAIASYANEDLGTLEVYFENPEDRLRYPLITTPKPLLDAMFREHCIRANAFTLFMAPNYHLATCAEWEWRWVADPDLEHSESLKVRMAANNGKFPGEYGDVMVETLLCFSLEADSTKAAESMMQRLENDRWYANEDKMQSLLETNEERFRGVRVIEAVKRSGNLVTMTVAIPMNKDKLNQERLEKFRRAIVLISNSGQSKLNIKSVSENTFIYCEVPDRRSFQMFLDDLARRGLSELKLAMESEWHIPIEPYMSQETCFKLIWEKFDNETAEWARQGKFRRQGRRRQGGYNQIMELSSVRNKVEKTKLTAEEIIALKLYTGPMSLLYNAALRGFPEKLMECLSTNMFETTVCILMSALVKLSTAAELPPGGGRLYCGILQNMLPDRFWVHRSIDDEPRGAVHFGFLSTTADIGIAVQLLPARPRIVLEILPSTINVGASMKFISQYPNEEEYLLRPLSFIEIVGRPRAEITSKGEVLVYPAHVNANLKISTVSQLIEKRKDLHLSIMKRFRQELVQDLDREILYSSGVPTKPSVETDEAALIITEKIESERTQPTQEMTEDEKEKLDEENRRQEAEQRIKRDAEVKARAIKETLKSQIPIIVKKALSEIDLIFKKHEEYSTDIFNNDIHLRRLLIEVIDSKRLAVRKVVFFKDEIEAGGSALTDSDMQQRILSTPINDFGKAGIELALRTGISTFPWQEVVEKKATIDFGQWTPAGIEQWKLDVMKQKLVQNDAIRKISIKGCDIVFPQGMLAPNINLDGQPVKKVVDKLSFMLSINTQLSALSIRNSTLAVADWNIILASLAACASLTVLNNCEWSNGMIVGGLKTLSLRDKEIGYDGAVLVGSLLPRSASSLTSLRLSNNLLGKEGTAAIAEGLVSLRSLHSLDLRGNALGVADWRVVLESLSSCAPLACLNGYDWTEDMISGSIVKLDFSRKLSLEEAVVISALLPRSSSSLMSIKFFSASLEEDGATAIAKGLRFLSALQTLDLGFNSICDEGASAISEGLRTSTNLVILSLRGNSLTKQGATVIAECIQQLESIQTLDLSTNSLQKEGIVAISDAFQRLGSLRSVDLRGNNLDVADWQNVLSSLSSCGQLSLLNDCDWTTDMIYGGLSTLSLWNKGIGPESAALISALLPRSSVSLTSLDLSTNTLRKEGAEFIAESFSELIVLRNLNVGSNSLQIAGATAISAGLRHLTALESLDIRVNGLEGEGASAIADALRCLTNLQALDFRYNALQREGATAIADVLRHLPALTSLDLRSNALQRDGAMAIFNGLRNNTALETLDLRSRPSHIPAEKPIERLM